MDNQHVGQKGKLSVRQDIINVILSRGELSKSDIQKLWGIDEEAYENLKEDLAAEKLIEPGNRRSGGFFAKFTRRPSVAKEQDSTQSVLVTPWEQTAIQRLEELLNHADLEELLGDLVYTIRRARVQLTGVDRRGTKTELAAALVTQHGTDLLAVPAVRKLIAKRAKVAYPGRWHPGKSAAREVCRGRRVSTGADRHSDG